MTTFYFNNIVRNCKAEREKVQTIFEETLREYANLCKRKELAIESGIVTEKDTESTTICGITLKKLIVDIDCEQKDLRKLAFAYFTRYPAEIEFKIEEVYQNDKELYDTYTINKLAADDLFTAYKKGWPLFTVPVENWLQTSQLTLVSSGNEEYPLISFYGNNHKALTDYILTNQFQKINPEEINGKKIADHQYKLFINSAGRHDIKVAPAAKARFYELSEDERNIAISMIEQALDMGMLFPTIVDKVHIKECRGAGNENTYELRKRSFGLRIYFMEHKENLLLCGIHTKAEGEGDEQSADINNATLEGNKLKQQLRGC